MTDDSGSSLCPIPEWLVDGQFIFHSIDIHTETGVLSGRPSLTVTVVGNESVVTRLWKWAALNACPVVIAVIREYEPACRVTIAVSDRTTIQLVLRFNEWLVRRHFRQWEHK